MKKYILALLVLLGAATLPADTPTSQTNCSQTTASATPCTATENVDCGCPTTGGTSAPSSSLLTGRTHYWNLNESSTGAAPVTRADSVGSATLSDTNTVASTSLGISSNAALFVSTSSEKLSRTNDSALFFGGASWTVAVWAKPANVAGNQHIVGTYATGKEWMIYEATNRWTFAWSVDGTTFSNQIQAGVGSAQAGTWSLIVAGRDHTTGKYFMQLGGGARTETAGSDMVDTTEDFSMGAGFAFYSGAIDEVGTWSRVLTTAEVACLYNSGAGSFPPYTGVCTP